MENINEDIVVLDSQQIRFPFSKPYKLQTRMMKMILEAIKQKKSLVIESPTGTGKTLCLLSATLEAVEKRGIKRVYYLTRTHSQMDGIIKEIKGTKYTPKYSILQSIKPLCVHPPALALQSKLTIEQFTGLCQKAKSQKCENRDIIPHCSRKTNFITNQNMQINTAEFPPFQSISELSDIKDYAQGKGYCPFNYVKALSNKAQLVIMPYMYLLNPFIFHQKNFDMESSVIIFDQAHNVIDQAKNQNSVVISSWQIVSAKYQLNMLTSNEPNPSSQNILEYINTRNTLAQYSIQVSKLHNTLQTYWKAKSTNSDHIFLKVKQIIEIAKPNFTGFKYFRQQNASMINELLLELADLKNLQNSNKPKKPRLGLKSILNTCYMLELIFKYYANDDTYLCILYSFKKQKQKTQQFTVKFHCTTSKYVFKRFNRTKSIIFASGTLNKDIFLSDTGLDYMNSFEIQYKDQNPYQHKNIARFEITSHKDGALKVNSDFPDYDNVIYFLTQLIPQVPNGVLVFFKNSSYMKTVQQKMKADNILIRNKRVFFEEQAGPQFNQSVQQYRIQALSENGAVFFSYMRGKLSEGFNFKDQLARAVFVVGLPLADLDSPEVKIEKRLQANFSKWYAKHAMQTVNQAIGRVMRHSQDYGLVFLIGEGLCCHRTQLPKWVLQGKVYKQSRVELIKERIEIFFKDRPARTNQTSPQNNKPFEQERIIDEMQQIDSSEDQTLPIPQSQTTIRQNPPMIQSQTEVRQAPSKSKTIRKLQVRDLSSDSEDILEYFRKRKQEREGQKDKSP